MSIAVKLRRGTTTEHATFTGLEGEVTVDTTKDTVVVHDGSTAGGVPLAKEADVHSIPTGGTTGQLLTKNSGTNYDAAWASLESLLTTYARTVDAFKQGTHSGLDFAYGIGITRADNVIARVSAGTVTLADDTTNYIEATTAGVVSANATGYTAGRIPLYTVVTASSAISTVQDDRCFFNVGGGGTSGYSIGWNLTNLSLPTVTTVDKPA